MLKRILLFILLQVARTLECVSEYQFMDKYLAYNPQSTWTSLFGNEIGRDSSGVAYKIPLKDESSAVLKKIQITSLSLDKVRAEAEVQERMNEVLAEAEMQKRMNDAAPSSTAAIYDCIQDDTNKYIMTEFVPFALDHPDTEGQDDEANSEPRLADFREFHPFIRLKYYMLLIEGLADIHDKGYVHNDIKRENIMFGTLPEPYIRYIDFGCACGLHDYPRCGTQAYMDSEFLYFFQQIRCLEDEDENLNQIVEAYEQRDDNYMTDIFALALTIYRIEFAPSFDGLDDTLVKKKDIIKDRDIWANQVANPEWVEASNINFCYIPKGKKKTDKVCFHDIIKRMINHRRSSVEPASRAQQPTIENADNPTLTSQLAREITRIYNSHKNNMTVVEKLFIEAEEKRALVSQPSETSEVRVLI